MTETIWGMAETIPDGSLRPRRHDGGMAVDDGSSTEVTEPIWR